MTTTPVPPVDIDLLRREIRRTYAAVSEEPGRDFIFPTGRSWAEDLEYPGLLANVPDRAVESFAGVANPFSLGALEPGEDVLDIGSGAGTDSLVAAQMVGPTGSVTGIDMTPEMLASARAAATEMGLGNVTFIEADAERLPFDDASFDVVISNGVIDLIPDKDALLDGEYGEILEEHGFERVEHGNLVATYLRSTFEDTRRKALKFGANGATVKAFKPTG
jgi:arsenite methyltransferase